MQKQATETLDGVNTKLDKVDEIMPSVVDITEKVDKTATSVEGAVSTVPAQEGGGVRRRRVAGRLELLQSRRGADAAARPLVGAVGAPASRRRVERAPVGRRGSRRRRRRRERRRPAGRARDAPRGRSAAADVAGGRDRPARRGRRARRRRRRRSEVSGG